ncbi:hypothetical protein D3C73_719290 [compost metagenome]
MADLRRSYDKLGVLIIARSRLQSNGYRSAYRGAVYEGKRPCSSGRLGKVSDITRYCRFPAHRFGY